jgi:hypothetical protein
MTANSQNSLNKGLDLSKLDRFTTSWSMFLHKINNPQEFLLTAIDHLMFIFKPAKLSLFIIDKKFQ